MEDELRTLLQRLRQEIEASKSLEKRDRLHLERLVDDLEARVERDSAIERTRDAMQRFEVSYPQLTAILGRVVDTLSNIGI